MKIIVVVFFILGPGLLLGSEATLDTRRADATQRINDATSLIQNYGLQKVALDTYFYGPRGVNTLASQWLSESQTIVNAIEALSTLKNVTDVSAARQAIQIVQSFYNNQGPAVARLTEKSKLMDTSAQRIRSLSANAKSIPGVKTEELKTLYQQLEDSRVRSEEATRSIKDSVLNLQPKILDILTTSKPILIGKLKKFILEKGWKELEGPVADAEALMTFESEARPLISQLENLEMALTDASLNFAFFRATDAKDEALNACAQFERKLSAIPLTTKYRTKSMDRKAAVCKAVDTMWASLLQSGLSKQDMVKEYGASRKAEFADACKQSSQVVNCEKFAILASIPASAIDRMTDEQLRFYEDGWYGLEKSL